MEYERFFSGFFFCRIVFHRFHRTDHLHDNGSPMHYIGVMLSGSGLLVSERQTVSLKAGDVFFIPKGYLYESHWTPENKEVAWISLGFDLFPFPFSFSMQKLSPDEEAMQWLKKIVQTPVVNEKTVGYLYAFLCSTISSAPPTAADRAIAMMRQDAQAKISEIAKRCRISESGLYALFQRELHKTPNEVRREVLCEQAQRLLLTTDLSVEDISRLLGFSSSSYFRKVFFAGTKKTPREYRRSKQFSD